MKAPRIEAATVDFDAGGAPRSIPYDDRYHPEAGALAQARRVFLEGNGLPGRWAGRSPFTILETGFGIGHNFLATWQAWRDDPARPERLSFVSIERHPLDHATLARALGRPGATVEAGDARGPAAEPVEPGDALRDSLLAQWPLLTPDLHRLAFDDERVELLLAFGDVRDWLPRLALRADAIYLDGFDPRRNPAMWDAFVCRGLAIQAGPDATLATWCTARTVRDNLAAAGFECRRVPGLAPKRHMLIGQRHPESRRAAERRSVARAGGGAPGAAAPRHACVVGAGLAGCSIAHALAARGWTIDLLDGGSTLAGGASGNPAGIFHGTLHAGDGPHTRWNRIASLAAAREYRPLVASGRVPGAVEGLLRLERELDLPGMAARLAAAGLPEAYVEALDADTAARRGGMARSTPAWHYAEAGWISPAALCQAWLDRHARRWRVQLGTTVERLVAHATGWQVYGPGKRPVADAPIVIVAAPDSIEPLLGPHSDATRWPIHPVRGQVSWIDNGSASAPLRMPLASGAYAVSLPGGRLLFGSTSQPGDRSTAATEADDRANLARLAELGVGVDPAWVAHEGEPSAFGHRAGVRWAAVDRLPVVGAVPAPAVGWEPGSRVGLRPSTRASAAAATPRVPGLYVLTALGSRGLTWAPLAASLLAALIEERALPVERPLAERLDPARFNGLSRALASMPPAT
jgi:tRNA 5-methylaminomethyl-2-thiouridine biosynthesis bifunctional protein